MEQPANITPFKLSPSDFGFLYNECKHCFYNKVKLKQVRPAPIMPAIFTKIDNLMKEYFENRSTKDISSELPPGKVHFGDKWIQSRVLVDKLSGRSCFIKGRTDTVVAFDDGTHGIVDFKTSHIRHENVIKYARQLHAYALALEKAAPNKPHLPKISKLGLFVVEHKKIIGSICNNMQFDLDIKWQPIERNDEMFKEFLREVLYILNQPVSPKPDPNCGYCKYKYSHTNLSNVA